MEPRTIHNGYEPEHQRNERSAEADCSQHKALAQRREAGRHLAIADTVSAGLVDRRVDDDALVLLTSRGRAPVEGVNPK